MNESSENSSFNGSGECFNSSNTSIGSTRSKHSMHLTTDQIEELSETFHTVSYFTNFY